MDATSIISNAVAFLLLLVGVMSWRASRRSAKEAARSAKAAEDALPIARASAQAARDSAEAAKEAIAPAWEAARAGLRSAEAAEWAQYHADAPEWEIEAELPGNDTCRVNVRMKEGPNEVRAALTCIADISCRSTGPSGTAGLQTAEMLLGRINPGERLSVPIDLTNLSNAVRMYATVTIVAAETGVQDDTAPRRWERTQVVEAHAPISITDSVW